MDRLEELRAKVKAIHEEIEELTAQIETVIERTEITLGRKIDE